MVLGKILKKVKPTKLEEEKLGKLVEKLISMAKTLGFEPVVVGSIGKKTWLKKEHDIDLFILFPKAMFREQIEKTGLDVGKKIAEKMKGSYKIKYAEHPYTQARIKFMSDFYNVDVVPCYRINEGEKILSAVDRSPLHLKYVLTNLEESKRDEVRLLKQFMKGLGIYGSDAKTLGFSGYICELLILKYGSFDSVLKAASSWSAQTVITFNGVKKRFKEPLVIIDPTDVNRNAAAALSGENFLRFINAAKMFLKSPNEKFFFPKEKPLGKNEIKVLRNREMKFLSMIFPKPDLIDDILYPQLRKTLQRFTNLLRHEEFYVLRSYEFADKNAILFFELEVWELPKIEKMIGPPIFSKKHTEEFLSKYAKLQKKFGPYVEDKRWVVEKEREFKTASQLVKSFIKKGVSELIANGIPDNIAKPIKKSKILEDKKFWNYVKRNKEFSAFLRRKYFEKFV